MKKILKIMLSILGVILLGIGILVVVFLLEMKPDKDKEEEVRIQAEQYLEDNFNDNFEIYDTFYDNMGNFAFEYAASVREKKTNIEFLAYYDDETKQMVDTYIADKWKKDLKSEICPFIEASFGETTDFVVYFTNDNIGRELDIDPLKPKSYKEFDVEPIIRITVPRKKSDDDEKILNELIASLKSEDKLKHGSIAMSYNDEKGVILDDEWHKDF
ncbi:hypothetical protein [Psychrobacillus antarcticus]|uniref:hypothetical protein n=1 Tax=Psychrobacillus antarcticus TaxID=2879115 RepID=UPI0024088CF5|nr:hypothetical protein [Psychrobacillus antarcticus]